MQPFSVQAAIAQHTITAGVHPRVCPIYAEASTYPPLPENSIVQVQDDVAIYAPNSRQSSAIKARLDLVPEELTVFFGDGKVEIKVSRNDNFKYSPRSGTDNYHVEKFVDPHGNRQKTIIYLSERLVDELVSINERPLTTVSGVPRRFSADEILDEAFEFANQDPILPGDDPHETITNQILARLELRGEEELDTTHDKSLGRFKALCDAGKHQEALSLLYSTASFGGNSRLASYADYAPYGQLAPRKCDLAKVIIPAPIAA